MSALSRKVRLTNRDGLHARPIGQIVELAHRYEACLKIGLDGCVADGHSILQLMSLGARKGAALELMAEGPDAASLLDALQVLIEDGFGED